MPAPSLALKSSPARSIRQIAPRHVPQLAASSSTHMSYPRMACLKANTATCTLSHMVPNMQLRLEAQMRIPNTPSRTVSAVVGLETSAVKDQRRDPVALRRQRLPVVMAKTVRGKTIIRGTEAVLRRVVTAAMVAAAQRLHQH